MQTQKLPFQVKTERIHIVVGLIATLLPFTLWLISTHPQICSVNSISHFYYTPIGGDIFVAALGTIGVILLVIYGVDHQQIGTHKWVDIYAARLAGFAALGVAFIPALGTGCIYQGEFAKALMVNTMGTLPPQIDTPPFSGQPTFDFIKMFSIDTPLTAHAHYIFAAILFSILLYFCFYGFTRVQSHAAIENNGQLTKNKKRRNKIYYTCSAGIAVSMIAIGLKFTLDDTGSAFDTLWQNHDATFWFESLGLWSFGIAWMLKGRIFGLLRDP